MNTVQTLESLAALATTTPGPCGRGFGCEDELSHT
jgi:hypothetical protein